MGKHEIDQRAVPAGEKKKRKKKHTGLWILLAVLVVLVCYLAWFLLTPPGQNQVGPVTPPVDVQPETPDTPEDPGTSDDQPDGPDASDPATKPAREMKKGVYTILLAGTTDSYNTDTMMLCSVDSQTNKVKLVSINRDTQIDTDAKNNKKINAAYGRKGPEGMCQAVTDLTGVPINYYVAINMESFKTIVDLVGGVEYDVPFDMYHPDLDKKFHIDLKEGQQTLDGSKALMFVRYRSTSENDFGRVNRQKDFLIAAMKQVIQKFSVTQIQDYIQVFNDNVKTNMSVQDMVWFFLNVVNEMDFATDMTSDTLPYASTGYYNKVSYVYLDPQTIVDYVNENLNPYTTPLTLEDVNIPHLEN